MINRSVNIRIALQSAMSRGDGSDSQCSVRASELLTNRMGWLDNCSIDCISTSSDFIFHATKCRPHTTDITASIIREERQFKLKKTQNIYYIVQTTFHKPHHLMLLLSILIENNCPSLSPSFNQSKFCFFNSSPSCRFMTPKDKEYTMYFLYRKNKCNGLALFLLILKVNMPIIVHVRNVLKHLSHVIPPVSDQLMMARGLMSELTES